MHEGRDPERLGWRGGVGTAFGGGGGWHCFVLRHGGNAWRGGGAMGVALLRLRNFGNAWEAGMEEEGGVALCLRNAWGTQSGRGGWHCLSYLNWPSSLTISKSTTTKDRKGQFQDVGVLGNSKIKIVSAKLSTGNRRFSLGNTKSRVGKAKLSSVNLGVRLYNIKLKSRGAVPFLEIRKKIRGHQKTKRTQ